MFTSLHFMHMHFGLETLFFGFVVCIIYMVIHRSIVRSFHIFLSVSRYSCSDSDSNSRLLLVLSYAHSLSFLSRLISDSGYPHLQSHWLLVYHIAHCTVPTRSRSFSYIHISSIMMSVNDPTPHELSYFCVILSIPILLQYFFFAYYRLGFAIISETSFFTTFDILLLGIYTTHGHCSSNNFFLLFLFVSG